MTTPPPPPNAKSASYPEPDWDGTSGGLDPKWLAMHHLNATRDYDACIDLCTKMLEKNPYDQQAWVLKTRALTAKNWIDETEMEEEGVAEIMMDENATAQVARPGTSFARPNTSASRAGGGVATGLSSFNQGMRPMTRAGAPMTGFARPATAARPSTGSSRDTIETAFRGSGRPGTSRPVSSAARLTRLGTATQLSEPGGPFIDVDKLDLRKYAQKDALARALIEYIMHHDRNPKKAVELASLATVNANFKDWWWKERLGVAYYQLGMYRDAEKQFKSSLKDQPMIKTVLQLAKVYIRIDQPAAAMATYVKGAELFPGETSMLLGQARIHDALNDMHLGVPLYKEVLKWDASNVEAIACLAANHFYTDQPEIALRFYRRLLMMGVNNTELWNNLGLCCFYASQYDMTLACFERAIKMADDEEAPDVWFNVGQVAIGIGDLGLAYQALKIAVSVDSTHAESFNNLGVLELRKGNVEAGRANFEKASREAEHAFEPAYNHALLAFKTGEFQEAYERVEKALECYPEHADSVELKKQLKKHFTLL